MIFAINAQRQIAGSSKGDCFCLFYLCVFFCFVLVLLTQTCFLYLCFGFSFFEMIGRVWLYIRGEHRWFSLFFYVCLVYLVI